MLSGKIALITGGSRGIGKEIALKFAENGATVISGDLIDPDYSHENVSHVKLNVTDRENIKEIANEIKEKYGRLDILVNNAGLALGLDKFQEYDIVDIERMIDTNIKGLLYVTRQILPSMVANDEGHIINIGSTAGIYAYAGAAVYCATKSAVKVLSDGIRIDTIDKNIKVTTVQPGIVETNFSNVRFHGNTEQAKKVYEGIEALKPEDIANTIVYIANQPKHVQISDITIMATNQATGFNIYRKNQNK